MHKKRLDSWKAIAEFLGRSLRTVQRWHALNNLPVHHFGGSKGSVFAYEEEIDAWLAGMAENSGNPRPGVEDQMEAAKRTSRQLTATAGNMWETRSINNVQVIVDLYHKAIDHDSTNTSAFIGLANAMIFSAMSDVMDASIAFPIAQDALRRISPMESDSIDAKCPAAWIDLLYSRNWRQARARFEEVVAKRPSSSFARSGLAMSRVADGNADGAVECGWEAWRLNPLVRSLGGLLCWFVYLTGDFKRVLDLTAQMSYGTGNGSVTGMVEALVLAQEPVALSNLARLEALMRDQPESALLQGVLGYAYGVAGDGDKARGQLARLRENADFERRGRGYPSALIYMGMREDEEAIACLERAYAESSIWSLGFRSDTLLRRLNGQPRFERLLSKIGAPETYRAIPDVRTRFTGIVLDRTLIGER